MFFLVHIAGQEDSNFLVCIAASTNKVAGNLYAVATLPTSAEEIVRLATTLDAAPGKFNYHEWNWTRPKVDGAIPVEVALLTVANRAIHCLDDLLRGTVPKRARTLTSSPIRELLLFLLTLRHEYLDEHVYSACEKMKAKGLDTVNDVVSSVSTLLERRLGLRSYARQAGYY